MPTFSTLSACVVDSSKFLDDDDDLVKFVNIAPCAFNIAASAYPPEGTDYDIHQGRIVAGVSAPSTVAPVFPSFTVVNNPVKK